MEQDVFAQRTDLSALSNAINAVQQQIRRVIVGQDELVRLIITALLADGHVLLEGVPGVAKTLSAKLTAKSLDVPFSRIQFTPDLMPSDVLGTPVFNPREGTFDFKKGPLFSNIVLIDEINRAPAKTQSALFEVMEERQITIDGKTYPMAPPFMVIATQNPIEQEGTYRLPEAQLDRFLFKIVVPYPSAAQEFQILQQFSAMNTADVLSGIEAVLRREDIITLRQQVRTFVVDEKLLQFIADFVHQTRNHKSIYLGASPRASIAVMNAAKAMAALNGRDFVTPDDLQEVIPPVLRHRIILSPEKEMEGVTEDAVIKQILQTMDIPR
ncbi:AAA family ATPase [Flaviaesturariibacter aridisoli]|uniref:MoxR family ATPase n=1 Tax=Flaviaesturariibacter aridisoli TaxID=2545761 RepID=A0A4R4E5K1_9BACT|nr:MoxR family ATPase [Flaviaesturariibacter aridisoli]TCZ73311.1 MoxR family ATPase [Flaviaesturariibacter aridisoli]